MKLRQLMTNSLQKNKAKSKDRKKKEEEEKERKKKQQKEPEKGGLFSSRRSRKESTSSVKNNREVSQSRRTKSDSDCGKTKKGQKFHDYATINYGNFSRNRKQDNDDYYYIEDKLRHFRDNDVINVNFNINTVDSKCACFKHIDAAPLSGYYNPDATEVFPSGELQNSFLTVTDNNYNSLPKTRTRIKTNPWLPSPRETPTPSVTSSMTSSMTSSPDDFPADGRCFEPADEFEYHHGDDLPALNTLNRPTPPIRDNSASAISQSEYNVLQRSFTSDTDNENCSFQPHHNPATRPVHSSAEEISATALTNPDQNDCFDYEAAFESQIESAKVTRVYGSRDLLDEYGSRDTLFDDVSGSYGVPSRRRKPFLILRYSRRFEEQESTEETDDTLKGEERSRPRRPPERVRRRPRTVKTRMIATVATTTDESADDGVETGSEGDYVPEDHEPEDLFDPNDPLEAEKSERTTLNESIDSAIETATCSSDSAGDRSLHEVRSSLQERSLHEVRSSLQERSLHEVRSSFQERSLHEVRSSLQEKVHRLRQEKLVVDEKIRQAQEEERFRVQERMKLQKQLTLERKQILLRTLRDLKVKLESQSERLQSTYNNVLYMQKQFIRHKRRGKPLVAIESSNMREAPF